MGGGPDGVQVNAAVLVFPTLEKSGLLVIVCNLVRDLNNLVVDVLKANGLTNDDAASILFDVREIVVYEVSVCRHGVVVGPEVLSTPDYLHKVHDNFTVGEEEHKEGLMSC